MFNLKGKVALVTGGARGMGRSHALTLAAQGATVIITGSGHTPCEPVVQEIKKKHGKAECHNMDVTDNEQIDRVISHIIKKYKRLDIVVNNAGIYQPRPALDITEEEWERTIQTNLRGEFFVAQRAAREMKKKKHGRIINIASIASGGIGVGVEGGAHYAASKGGIIGFTETLALEWAKYGITVNAIGPGAIDTPMIRSAGLTKKQLNDLMKSTVPMGRVGKPEEVSAVVALLASDEASYITGATLYVDGGWLAQ